jgi:hypothetical protein
MPRRSNLSYLDYLAKPAREIVVVKTNDFCEPEQRSKTPKSCIVNRRSYSQAGRQCTLLSLQIRP